MQNALPPLVRYTCLALLIAVSCGCIYVFFRWFAAGIVPFLIAFALTAFIHPAAAWMHKHSRGSLRFCSITAAALVLCGLGGFVFWGAGKLIGQMGAFLKQGMETLGQAESWREILPEQVLDWTDQWFGENGQKGITGWIPERLLAGESAEKTADALWLAVQEGISGLAGWLTGAAGTFMGALPGLFFGCVIAVIAVFYLAADTEKGSIRRDLFRLLPVKCHPAAEKAEGLARRSLTMAGQYIRAYAALGSVTFLILFAGFSVLGVRYGMVWAFLTALSDLLPFIGCGCVLLPWAVWSFLTGSVWKGVGLCVLLVVNWVVRQFLEPRILGRMMGVHPFWMLTAMYLGLKWFGIGGMAAFPVLLGILGSRAGEDVG